MSVRRATPDDARALSEVHIRSWQDAYRGIFSDEFLEGLIEGLDRRADWWEKSIADGMSVFVVGDEEVLGFCNVGASRSEVGWGELFAIYVHPDRWGTSDGYELIQAAEAELAHLGHDRALLWVLEHNDRARRFYERNSWQLTKPLKIEEIGDTQVTEVRYEKYLRGEV